jgi:chromosome transmission fidelity protein 1
MDLLPDSLVNEASENMSNASENRQPTETRTKATTEQHHHQFNFPFPPYDIQVDLMKVAYDTFEESKFALLESPTGTGKSLSLICSSLTWLRDYQRRERGHLEEKKRELTNKIEQLDKEEEESGDWLKVQTKRQEVSDELSTINKQLERLNRFDERNKARQHARLHGVPLENYSTFLVNNNNDLNKTLDGPLNETRDTNILGDLGPSSQNSHHSELAEDGDIEKKMAQQDEDHTKPKIYYASRTHSQLSQFINEVKRTKFADLNATDNPPIKVAALASRANLCVNPEVLKLKESSAINEKCMELQKETKSEKRCPYIKAKEVNHLKDDILSSVYDIEDLVSRGRAKGACPYYASRMAIPEAELVVLPYNNLLHRETRLASSLDLKESVVIVDEAHNILETICSIHSAPITGLQLVGCHTIFSRYYKKFSSKMSPRNAMIVKIIVQCLTALIRFLSNPRKHIKDYECPKAIELDDDSFSVAGGETDKHILNDQGKICKRALKDEEFMIEIAKFAGASNIERFNVYKIVDYLNRSQLARKLLGFFKQDAGLDLTLELFDDTPPPSDSMAGQATKNDDDLKSPKRKKKKSLSNAEKLRTKQTPSKVPASQRWQYTSLSFLVKSSSDSKAKQEEKTTQLQSYPVYNLIEFLRSLTDLHDDGKILTDFKDQDIYRSSLKFLLLNPSSQFKQMTEEARSIVLAGGTMQPFDEFLQLLFGPLGVDEKRITLFSCGHVVSPNNLFMASLSHGPSNKPLELSYKVRNSYETIDELGRTIMNISFIVPGGMVCFLPSYEYEHTCFTRWTQIGIISKIESRCKHVFREPRQASHLKPIFDDYSKRIEAGKTSGRGSLLFCVVGGKMSEGINFNDDLGRCVVMVGLPYANIKSGELIEKMNYYDKTCKGPDCPNPGQRYYENLCLKGINQSIGRAIRHKNDYAAVILLDRRYQVKSSIKDGLPKWMCKSLSEHERFGSLFSQLKAFYNNIQQKQS